MAYAFEKMLPGAEMDDVLRQVSDALQREGFGVITEINLSETLKSKLGVDIGPYRILGACNPQLASKALEIDKRIGVLLPCNVVVHASEGGVRLVVVNPAETMRTLAHGTADGIAAIAAQKLAHVVASVH